MPLTSMDETLTPSESKAVASRAFLIPAAIKDQMLAHAFAELPDEACGLLAGPDGAVERFFPMVNADHSPFTYRLDSKEQLRVFNQIDDAGWALHAIFHSHTHTEAYPSPTDRRQAFYPDVMYVLASLADRNNPVIRAFTIVNDEVTEQEVSSP